MIGIYKITNIINNKCYVGSSVNITGRWYQHKTELKFNKHHSIKLQRSYNKHGVDNFKYEIIEECDIETLIIREQYYIDLFGCYKNGYNSVMSASCPMLGMSHSKETKEILRQKSVGNKNMLNKKHTEETKDKIRKKLKGVSLSDETKSKMSKSRKGRIVSDETKLKLSKSHTGKILSKDHKIKLSLSHLGKKQSEETIEKRVKLNTGKKRTDESKKKISDKLMGIVRGPMSDKQKQLRSKRVALITENGDIIKEYNGIKICANDNNIHHQRLWEVLSGKRISFKNLYFKYI